MTVTAILLKAFCIEEYRIYDNKGSSSMCPTAVGSTASHHFETVGNWELQREKYSLVSLGS